MVRPRKRKNESDAAFIQRAALEYYEDGYHVLEITNKLGVDAIEIYNIVVPNGNITTEDEREVMIKLRGDGLSLTKISEMTGRSRSCVRRRLEGPAKVCPTGTRCISDSNLEYIKKHYLAGESMTDIAKALGLTRGAVTYRLKRSGIYDAERNNERKVTSKEVAKFKRLAKKGLSVNEIAKRTGRGKETVRRYLNGISKPMR